MSNPATVDATERGSRTLVPPEMRSAQTANRCLAPEDSEPETKDTHRLDRRRFPIIRVALALVFAGQTMALSIGYSAAVPRPAFGTAEYLAIHTVLIVSSLLVIALMGWPLLRETTAQLTRGVISVEALFSLSLGGALVGSLLASLTGTGSVYYEVVAVVLAVYTTGQALADRSRERVVAAADRLRDSFSSALVIPAGQADGGLTRLMVEAINPAVHRVVVHPGEPVAVDGMVVSGEGELSDTALTGELKAHPCRSGDRVLAGSYLVDGRLVIKPDADQSNRQVAAVVSALAEARMKPANIQRRAEAIARGFVPVVAGVASATFAGWFWLAGSPWQEALLHAMAVLLVACPCALGLATPVTVWAGLQRLAAHGLVARNGRVVDALAATDCVVFDKTGTLTTARATVTEATYFGPFQQLQRQTELHAALLAVEADVTHPVAQALRDYLETHWQGTAKVDTWRRLDHGGITARVLINGQPHAIAIGNDRDLIDFADPSNGNNALLVTVDGTLACRYAIEEQMRPGTINTLCALRNRDIHVEILTGAQRADLPEALNGIPIRIAARPADKAHHLKSLKERFRHIVYVGDGANDLAALGESSCALAMASGSDITRVVADGVLTGDSIEPLPGSMRVSARLMRSLRRSYGFALVYNVAGMALAAAGVLHPVAAALIMVGSSIFVAGRAFSAASESTPDPANL